MAELQPIVVQSVIELIDEKTVAATAVLDGVTINMPIYKKSTQYGLRKYVKFTTERGLLTRVALVDSQGREWYVKEMNYTIGQMGYVVAFPVEVEIITKEVSING